MNNTNFDENTINHLKNMLEHGDLNNIISQIPPDMIKNFSSMMENTAQSTQDSMFGTNQINNSNTNNQNINSQNSNNKNVNSSQNINNQNSQNINNKNTNSQNINNPNSNNSNFNIQNFDFSKIDMNTILKMKSIMEKLNTSNDSRSNLLYSLKPYLRESKKEKLDQYANLLNVAKIADLLKNNDKENHTQ